MLLKTAIFLTSCLIATVCQQCSARQQLVTRGYTITTSYNTCSNPVLLQGCQLVCQPNVKTCTRNIQGTACQEVLCNMIKYASFSSLKLSISLCGIQPATNMQELVSSNFAMSIFIYVSLGILGLGMFVLALYCCFCRDSLEDDNCNDIPSAVKKPNLVDFNLDLMGPYLIDQNETCIICLDQGVNMYTRCGHSYHTKCFQQWLCKKTSFSCPLCMQHEFNPVKVYCMQCQQGLRLENITQDTSVEATTMCDQCKVGVDQKQADRADGGQAVQSATQMIKSARLFIGDTHKNVESFNRPNGPNTEEGLQGQPNQSIVLEQVSPQYDEANIPTQSRTITRHQVQQRSLREARIQ